MQSEKRRAFLTGRRQPLGEWGQFINRLSRRVSGDVLDFGYYDGVGSARLLPRSTADVRVARRLCAETNTKLVLAGVEQAQAWTEHSVLWVEPEAHLTRFQAIEDQPGKWFVQPGCKLKDLVEAGLHQFEGAPPYLSVAAWLADRVLCDWPTGQLAASGVLYASALFAEGSHVTLGPFGTNSRLALEVPLLQKTVPLLFELGRRDQALACQQQVLWPGRYRLDALSPKASGDINLAHLLLGHGGDLVWVEWLVIEALTQPIIVGQQQPPFRLMRAADMQANALELDEAIKQLFDPHGVYPRANQML